MAFDAQTLAPKYELLMDQVGESNAFWIAKEKGLSGGLLAKAATYLKGTAPTTLKKTFAKNSSKTVKAKAEAQPAFGKGDRVLLTETGAIGLFYELQDTNEGRILIDKKLQTVPLRRLQLEMPAAELYPQGYDLDSLFTDFRERKFLRDLERGSKKAQKQLRKNAKRRSNTVEGK